MNKTIETYLVATASTPTTTNMQAPFPPPASSLDVTSLVLTAAISAVLSGGVVGTVLKIWSDRRLEKQHQCFQIDLELLKDKNTRKLDFERYGRADFKELVDTCESLLQDQIIAPADFFLHIKVKRLRRYFSDEFDNKLLELVSDMENEKDDKRGRELNAVRELQFRELVIEEMHRLRKEWDLV